MRSKQIDLLTVTETLVMHTFRPDEWLLYWNYSSVRNILISPKTSDTFSSMTIFWSERQSGWLFSFRSLLLLTLLLFLYSSFIRARKSNTTGATALVINESKSMVIFFPSFLSVCLYLYFLKEKTFFFRFVSNDDAVIELHCVHHKLCMRSNECGRQYLTSGDSRNDMMCCYVNRPTDCLASKYARYAHFPPSNKSELIREIRETSSVQRT